MTTHSELTECIDGLCFLLDKAMKTATLLPKMEGKYSGDIVVPEKVKGNDGYTYTVVAFGGRCFYDCSGLTSITIPSSVTSLGEQCFSNCGGLTSIEIPFSVISVGFACFSYCWSLTSIEIPSSVISLGYYCFYYCI